MCHASTSATAAVSFCARRRSQRGVWVWQVRPQHKFGQIAQHPAVQEVIVGDDMLGQVPVDFENVRYLPATACDCCSNQGHEKFDRTAS